MILNFQTGCKETSPHSLRSNGPDVVLNPIRERI